MKMKILKIGSLVLTVLLGVGIFFTVKRITAKHQVVSIHKVINKETGEEITVYEDPELGDLLDDLISDLDVDEDDLLDWMEDNLVLDPDSEDIVEDDLVIPDQAEEKKYESKNPKNGSSIAEDDKERTINISLNKVAYSDFMSMGGNTFSELTSDAAVKSGFDSVDWELTKYYYYKLNAGYSRMLFNMDCMITDSYGGVDPKFEDNNDNADYVNYIEGRYSFDNEKMDSFRKMMEIHRDNGTEVWLNTGWKVLSRIQSWYGFSSKNPFSAAPYDLKAFVKANIALLMFCEEEYPGTVTYITFGNEAANHGDFANDGDTYRYTTVLYTLMSEAIRLEQSKGYLKGIKLACGEDAVAQYTMRDQTYLYTGAKLLKDNVIDAYSTHYYLYDGEKLPIFGGIYHNYSQMFDFLCNLREVTYGTHFLNETGVISYDQSAFYEGLDDYEGWWKTTTTGLLIGAANSGTKGVNRWYYGPEYWPHLGTLTYPDFTKVTKDNVTEYASIFETTNNLGVSTQYYTTALLQNYITAHSDVLLVNWEGEDIRVAAFKLSDGNYTFVVEANESELSERKLTFELGEDLGKDLYRIAYSEVEELNVEKYALIPLADEEWTRKVTDSSFVDTIDGSYCTYVYTTKKPVEQLKSEHRVVTVKAGEQVKLDVQYVGEEDNVSQICWEIVASATSAVTDEYIQYAAEKGTIGTNDGQYVASPNAKSGDRILVKAIATLDDGTEIYSVILVKIQ